MRRLGDKYFFDLAIVSSSASLNVSHSSLPDVVSPCTATVADLYSWLPTIPIYNDFIHS